MDEKELKEEVSNVAESQATESPVELKGRAKFAAKFKEKNPEANYDEDEIFFNALEEYDSERENELSGWREWDSNLRKRIEEEPRAGQFLSNIMSGNDLISSLIDTVGADIVDAINSPEARAKLEEASQKAKQFEDERQANIEASQAVIDEFVKDKDAEDVDRFDDYILDVLDKLAMGKFDTAMLQSLWNGFKHDDDVAIAAEDGEIRGRNETIMAKKQDMGGGDGVPSLAAASSAPSHTKRSQAPAKRNRSIWDAE